MTEHDEWMSIEGVLRLAVEDPAQKFRRQTLKLAIGEIDRLRAQLALYDNATPPAEAVLEREYLDADVLWEEGKQNDTYHETESLDDAWERLFRSHISREDPILMYLTQDAGGYYGITKYSDGRYLMKRHNKSAAQIRRAKGQS